MWSRISQTVLAIVLGASFGFLGCDLGTDPLPEQACTSSPDCPDGLYCLVQAGVCVQCLMDEHCEQSGKCDETRHVCEEPTPECTSAAECATDSNCQVAQCQGGACLFQNVANGTACDDGNECTEGDQCTAGECLGAAIAGCGLSGCEGLKDGSACDDGNDCTADDSCVAGECVGLGVPGCGTQQDVDQDGYTEEQGDCNDENAAVFPGADEACDSVDNNCDGQIDEGCVTPVCFASGCYGEICSDADVDSICEPDPSYDCLAFSTCGNFGPGGACGWEQTQEYLECLAQICTPSEEICDGVDNDCNGLVDEGCGAVCGGLAGMSCQNGEYCQYPENTCFTEDQEGTCVAVPFACDQIYAPVCGCDGITYDNLCTMASSMASLWYEGSCDTEACKNVAGQDFGLCLAILGWGFDGDSCVMISGCECGQYCPWIFSTKSKCEEACGLTPPTECELDTDCPEGMHCEVYCGNGWCSGVCQAGGGGDADGDGWTATDGDCDDNNSKIYPYAQEFCDQADNDCDGDVDENCGNPACGGFAGIACSQGSFCSFALGSCGYGDQMGTCVQMPPACPANYNPVCGCDSQTYGNECEAASAGVSIMSSGACPIYGNCKDLSDIDFGACQAVMGVALIGEECTWISGCGCGYYCDYFFESIEDCKAVCN